jgi:hypothetical protein
LIVPVFTRTWPALSALGAGLVHLAVASSSVVWMAVALIAIGLAELAWAITALATLTVPMPRLALAVALLPIAMTGTWALASVAMHHDGMAMPMPAASSATAPVPLALTSCLVLVMAFACARAIRLGPRRCEPSAPEQPYTGQGRAAPAGATAMRALSGVLLGAALVAGVTVPALGATDAGRHASMHMQM